MLSRKTWDLRLGAEIAREPVAVRYINRYRYVDDGSQQLSHNYVNLFGNFDLEGVQSFAATPNSSRLSHIGAARVDFGASASAIAKLRYSRSANKATGYEVDSSRFSGILSLRPARWLRIRGRYDRLEWDNDTPGASSRVRETFSGGATFRPVRAARFEGSYTWNRVDRSGGTEVAETTTKSFRIKGTIRPDRKLRLAAAWRHAEVDNPYGRVLRNAFSRIDGVILSPFGTEEDEFDASLTYMPSPGSSTVISYRRSKAENDSVNLEAVTQQLTAAGHVRIEGGLVLHARVFYYNNDVQRDVYLGVLAPLLEITRIPYDGKGLSTQFGASIPLGPGFRLKPSYGYTRAESVFDDANLGSGVAAPSEIDATINRATVEADIDITEQLGFLFVYQLDDYEDDAQPLHGGTIHWVFAGLAYHF
jgi:hypothetical protein